MLLVGSWLVGVRARVRWLDGCCGQGVRAAEEDEADADADGRGAGALLRLHVVVVRHDSVWKR